MATVIVRSTQGLRQEILARNHVVVSDEPEEAGGTDAGPNPYELLLGALGSCKAITLLMYSRRKGWDLQGVEVTLTHSRDYVRDCVDCPDRGARIERITVGLAFTGELDDAQKDRLRDIAERCPVHQTLSGRLEIVRAKDVIS